MDGNLIEYRTGKIIGRVNIGSTLHFKKPYFHEYRKCPHQALVFISTVTILRIIIAVNFIYNFSYLFLSEPRLTKIIKYISGLHGRLVSIVDIGSAPFTTDKSVIRIIPGHEAMLLCDQKRLV